MKIHLYLYTLLSFYLYGCQQPARIVYQDNQGNIITAADLTTYTGEVDYNMTDDQHIQPAAQQLHNEARTLGQSGQYEASILKLEAAIKLAPNWAYPLYDLAFTYLLKGDSAKALDYYQQTDKLQPRGFFTAKTAIYALEGEKAGKFPSGLYMAYLQIEWTTDETEKLSIARAITQQFPDFAPAWKELAGLLDDDTQRLEAINTGLLKSPDAETKGMLLINKALVLNNKGEKENARLLLGELIFAAETTTANIAIARMALKSIEENTPAS
ncbi:tetratricopeptide repeat protein [Chitinophaga rhizophila]|uniref:Tetratricopeptide repeat protein n=1 Tax=Chitinophaga rhizophila TaxID=2866212 RepID=A0ABS7GCF6_9BACT|nr:tetratricopeptide repeat protein [Chitinophaga rhizophila]MBW8684479.1 tetratricopeptide repeat protein [Chitinophaga rhizophila]